MTGILLFAVLVLVAFLFRASERRFEILERRIEELKWELEELRKAPAAPPAAAQRAAVTPAAAPPIPIATSAPEAPPPSPPPAAPEPFQAPAPHPESEPEPPPVQAPQATPEPEPEPEPEPIPVSVPAREWEAVVGGNWLNKAGILLLVIGIALFLGYSFTQLGPGGRSALALAVSVAMLVAGVAFESREKYGLFGKGLIGGGWAALYTTVYAMQAVPASKVIDNPLLGSVLLLAVAVGMVVHSLRYKSETVTGVAFFVAFATLGITPQTALSVIALVPLAAGMLYVSSRFRWSNLALFGLLATYGTCASRGDSGASLWQAQSVFFAYWLLFEGFDLLRARSRVPYRPVERALMPLNALAFAALSFLKWDSAAPEDLYMLAAGVGAAYLVSALLRAWLRPPSSFADDQDLPDRASAGGYEGPITLTAILSAAAVLLRLHGGWAMAALLVEAEMFYLAGLNFQQAYPRQLAACLFGVSFVKLLLFELSNPGVFAFAGHPFRLWTPAVLFAAGLLYTNRTLRKADIYYGYAASMVLTLVIGFETPNDYRGVSWFAFGAALFTFGRVRRLLDFRLQSYGVAALGIVGSAITLQTSPWWTLAAMSAGGFAAIWSRDARMGEHEQDVLADWTSWAVTALLAALVWRLTPEAWVGVAWLTLALALLELGMRGWPAQFRTRAYALAALAAGVVLFADVLQSVNTGSILNRLPAALAGLLAYAFAARDRRTLAWAAGVGNLFVLNGLWSLLPEPAVAPAFALLAAVVLEVGILTESMPLRFQSAAIGGVSFFRLGLSNLSDPPYRLLTVIPVTLSYYYHSWRWGISRIGRGYLWAAGLAATALLEVELGQSHVTIGWAALSVLFLVAGRRWSQIDLQWQSYGLAALASLATWGFNFVGVGHERVLVGTLVISGLFAGELLAGREGYSRAYFGLLGAFLLAILLFLEVKGAILTVAWSLEAVALLIVGFPLRDRVLRLTGLAGFLICILKLFVYDLRELETLYRILSFIVLGVILVGVSFIYTKFRDRIQRYL